MTKPKPSSKPAKPSTPRPTFFLALPLHTPYITPSLPPLSPHPALPDSAISPPAIHHVTLQLFTSPTPERILEVLNSDKMTELLSYSLQLKVEGLGFFGNKNNKNADDARVLWAKVGLLDGGEEALKLWGEQVRRVFAEEMPGEVYPPIVEAAEVETDKVVVEEDAPAEPLPASNDTPADETHDETAEETHDDDETHEDTHDEAPTKSDTSKPSKKHRKRKPKKEEFTPHLTLANTTFLPRPKRSKSKEKPARPHFEAASLIAEHASTIWGTPSPTAVTLCRMGTRKGGEWGPGYEVVGERRFGDVDVPGGKIKCETVIKVEEEVEGDGGEELGVGKDGRRGSVVWSVVKRGSVASEGGLEGLSEGEGGEERAVKVEDEKVEAVEVKV